MKSGQTRSFWVLVGLLLSIGSAQTAFADDTELFIAEADPTITGAQANILFMVDTSGSMTNDVVTQVPWDPNTTWSGCYEEDAIYFSTTGGKPGCGSNNYFWKSKFRCAAATQLLEDVGQFRDEFAAWRGNQSRWVGLNGNRKNRKVECQDDAGVHGENAPPASSRSISQAMPGCAISLRRRASLAAAVVWQSRAANTPVRSPRVEPPTTCASAPTTDWGPTRIICRNA